MDGSLVHGELNPEYFGLTSDTLTKAIFFVDSKNPINSVSFLTPTKFKPDEATEELPHVWKVFSQKPLTDGDLDEIFKENLETKVCDWLAYPDYSTNQTLSNFVLTNDLYHINAIEWSASAMEMSVIGAKNVANMIIEKYGISKEKSSNVHSRSEL